MVPINPVVESKSVVTATVSGDAVYYEDSVGTTGVHTINSNASIRLGSVPILYVGGKTFDTNVTSSTTLTLDGLQSGDLVLIFGASDTDNLNTPGSGWSEIPGLTTQPDNDNDPDSAVFYKFSTGTSITASDLVDDSVHVMMAFRGVDSSDPFDGNATAAESSAINGMPDPPSITTTTDNCTIVVVGMIDAENIDEDSVIPPTGYTLNTTRSTTKSNAASDRATVMTAYKLNASVGSEDPSPFVGSGSLTTDNKAYTIALKPGSTTTTTSWLAITIGRSMPASTTNFRKQTGMIDWQVIEYN
jgi:hypothetical protein